MFYSEGVSEEESSSPAQAPARGSGEGGAGAGAGAAPARSHIARTECLGSLGPVQAEWIIVQVAQWRALRNMLFNLDSSPWSADLQGACILAE